MRVFMEQWVEGARHLVLGLGVVALVGCSGSGASSFVPSRVSGARIPPAPQVSAKAKKAVAAAARSLDGSTNACNGFDYFPRGGLRSFYCHAQRGITVAQLAKLAGQKVFLKGPHKGGKLDLAAAKSFGHYNPAFVRWLGAAVHALGSKRLRTSLQPIYNRLARPLARIFYVSGRKLLAHRTFLAAEKKRYLGLVAAGQASGHYEPFFYFMNPRFIKKPRAGFRYFYKQGFDGGVSGNVTKTCVAFWIRRSIDGTAPLFFDALKTLLQDYDGRFLRAVHKISVNGDHRGVMK